MIILHGAILYDQFLLWAETDMPALSSETAASDYLPFAASYQQLRAAVDQSGLALNIARRQNAQATIWIPRYEGQPLSSSPMIGRSVEDLDAGNAAIVLAPYVIPALRLQTQQMIELLCCCAGDDKLAEGTLIGQDLRFWALAMQFAGALAAKQQFLPGMKLSGDGAQACWDPVFLGDDGDRLIRLAKGMPGLCLACESPSEDGGPGDHWRATLVGFLQQIVDYLVRKSLDSNHLPLPESIKDYATTSQPAQNIHSRWLQALRSENPRLEGTAQDIAKLCDQIVEWRRPVEVASDAPFRLCLRLEEPQPGLPPYDDDSVNQEYEAGKNSSGNGAEPAPSTWYLRFLLQSLRDPGVLLPVDVVLSPEFQDMQLLRNGRVHAREYLFRALGQAVRLCPDIARSFEQSVPLGVCLDSPGAYNFLSSTAAVLKNAGFSVQLPSWWTEKRKISARIHMSPFSLGGGLLNLNDLAEFDWQLSLGDVPVSIEELERLAQLKVPLIQMGGNWVEINPEKIESILHFFRKRISQKASGRELIKMALGDVRLPDGVTLDGITGDGPLARMVQQLQGQVEFEEIAPHRNFRGCLRPYQVRGLSWLEFLRTVGLGACLADDMGLGKTIQTLAFLQKRWQETLPAERLPSLLVCPTSVINNWQQEVEKFTPDLPVLLHHGTDRLRGRDLRQAAAGHALVLTTYALLLKDQADLKAIKWENAILDEAQNIKNPEAQQTKAACSLRSGFKIALSGTPVENHVGDLWSVMNFLNPGFLGRHGEFKERFLLPIQVWQDEQKAQQLKRLTAPFILRRLKTDKSIVPDLPEKLERKTHCHLAKEQATLYAAVVASAANSIDAATGIKRKSLILTTLLRLKQICDHPALIMADRSRLSGRSGKLKRLEELMRDIITIGERALIFTQFKQMGSIIQSHLERSLGREVIFLHGEVDRLSRARMVYRFQNEDDSAPIFVLSLRAGGTGLNLTRARHVVHFDRWWNPAVEDQATDRAFRIGQTRNVEVHKLVCPGTLEERIDDIIEQKKLVAASTIGSGEGWLTELSTSELRDIFSLRDTALVC